MRKPIDVVDTMASQVARILACLKVSAIVAAALTLLTPTGALAYIGPGAGLGAIAITVAFVLGLLLLVVGLVWYPLKRLFKGNRKGNVRADDSANQK